MSETVVNPSESQSSRLKMAVFSSKKWVSESFDEVNQNHHIDIFYFETRLAAKTARLAKGMDIVCIFVNDEADHSVIQKLKEYNVKLLALRCAGFNNVDLESAHNAGIGVVRVPAYSPYAIAEHTIGLIMALNRKFHKSYNRIREGNFSINGLLGFDLKGKTVGVIGTGKIGRVFIRILQGFGCQILAHDKFPNQKLKDAGIRYVELHEIYKQSDIISLHCPLMYETFHMINELAISTMKNGVMIVNTSRGPLIDTEAVIKGLKQGKVGYLGLDVYEEEEELFFEDFSEQVIQDDKFIRLQSFPNVLITAHQAFFTREAVFNISETTFNNINEFFQSGMCSNQLLPK